MIVIAKLMVVSVLGLSQNGPTTETDPRVDEVFAIGSSAEYQEAALKVATALNAGDFSQAAKLGALLPKRNVRILWDEKAVPVEDRAAFRQARDFALNRIGGFVRNFKFEFVTKNPDLAISFSKSLGIAPGSSVLRGAAHSLAYAPNEPAAEVVISTSRGQLKQPTSDVEVHNEVAYALGRYFGLMQTKYMGNLMGRTDLATAAMSSPKQVEVFAIRQNLDLADLLRQKAKERSRTSLASPKLVLVEKQLEAGRVIQGTPAQVDFQVANIGQGPLRLIAQGDCSCIGAKAPSELRPNETGAASAFYTTTELKGVVRHNVLMWTNDPDRPFIELPVNILVEPRVRILQPNGRVAWVEGDQASQEIFLVVPEGRPLNIVKAMTVGWPAEVVTEKWRGSLADPEMGEASQLRSGYRIRVMPKGVLPQGRTGVTLNMRFDDEQISQWSHTLYFQRGVLLQPSQIFIGGNGKRAGQYAAVISRPGRTVKVTRIVSDSKNLVAKARSLKGSSDVEIVVSYDGKAHEGKVDATIQIFTDDPSAPKLLLKVRSAV